MTAALDKPSTLQFCAWCPVANPVTVFKEVSARTGLQFELGHYYTCLSD